MCDYSLQHVASRPAKVGDKLISSGFKDTSSRGFTAEGDCNTAICLLPGTELAFDKDIAVASWFYRWVYYTVRLARFRQVELDDRIAHHDALELPDGTIVKLNSLELGQTATVLQLPAAPKTEAEEKEQTRMEVVG